MKYIDAHSHWSDPRLFLKPDFDALLAKATSQSIDYFLLGGISPEEWRNQITLKEKYPQNFGLCFGLHPYYVSDHEYEDCEDALDDLAKLLPMAMAIGEAGLDFRPHIMKDSQSLQIEMFENQIELAKAFQKPMVLHIVQAHDKAIQIFDLWDAPDRKGFVHAFTGSYDTAKKYIDKGFHISIGGAVTFDKNHKLQDCVQKMPLEYLLLESDSPDQAPEGWQGDNDSSSLYQVAEKIALIRNVSPFDILGTAAANFKRLFRMS
ncbi:MAG: TatD family hydrolase [Bdellovibrionaceae bacterium]|nr:TatD family hydrolase [Bdellovibrio sp.]